MNQSPFARNRYPRHERLQVVLGFQRLAGPEIVLVIVLDVAEDASVTVRW
jgi:hypothetical protein